MKAKQIEQFNRMRRALLTIAREYETPEQLRRLNKKDGDFMSFEEVLGMAYENIQRTAKDAIKGVKSIVVPEIKQNTGEHDY